jgi:hypothetical protein
MTKYYRADDPELEKQSGAIASIKTLKILFACTWLLQLLLFIFLVALIFGHEHH